MRISRSNLSLSYSKIRFASVARILNVTVKICRCFLLENYLEYVEFIAVYSSNICRQI